jgi:hypothetical protein
MTPTTPIFTEPKPLNRFFMVIYFTEFYKFLKKNVQNKT